MDIIKVNLSDRQIEMLLDFYQDGSADYSYSHFVSTVLVLERLNLVIHHPNCFKTGFPSHTLTNKGIKVAEVLKILNK